MRRVLFGGLLGLALSVPAIGIAAAAPAPGGGPEFGQHVADMAPLTRWIMAGTSAGA